MKYRNENRKIPALWLALGCFVLAFLISQGQLQKKREDLADRLSLQVLRFHVLANSDSASDQAVKLEMRSLILDYIQQLLPRNADKEETAACLSRYQNDIEECANDFLEKKGFGYRAHMQLTRCYFPTRVYGNMVFPCGTYDAVRITLGKGDGHNWWCVLYPRFCFVDAVCSEVPEESLNLLRRNLNQDDYLALEDHRPDIHIGFRLFPQLTVTLPSPAR